MFRIEKLKLVMQGNGNGCKNHKKAIMPAIWTQEWSLVSLISFQECQRSYHKKYLKKKILRIFIFLNLNNFKELDEMNWLLITDYNIYTSLYFLCLHILPTLILYE